MAKQAVYAAKQEYITKQYKEAFTSRDAEALMNECALDGWAVLSVVAHRINHLVISFV